MDPASAQLLQRRFLAAVEPSKHFFRLFDCLRNVLFFAKDLEGRLLAANAALLERRIDTKIRRTNARFPGKAG